MMLWPSANWPGVSSGTASNRTFSSYGNGRDMLACVLWRYFALNPIFRVGRELKLMSALTPRTLASAVSLGSSARCGNSAHTLGWLIWELVVQGIRSSSFDWSLIWTVPFTVVLRVNLYSPMKLTTVMELSGNDEIRPRAAPLPLLYPLASYGPSGGTLPLL